MKSVLSFLASAKRICLSGFEKATIRTSLANAVRNASLLRQQDHMKTTDGFLRHARNITLSSAEKVAIREALFTTMIPSYRQTFGIAWLNPFKSFTSVVASILIVTLCGASASYAADNSLPGDILYPIKVQVNERIHERMLSKSDRVRYATERAEMRLQEAEKLAEAGRLDQGRKSIVRHEFLAATKTVREHIKTLESENQHTRAHDVSASFETALKTRSRSLRAQSMKSSMPVEDLLDDVKTVAMDTEDARVTSDMASDESQTVATANVATPAAVSAKDDNADKGHAEEQMKEQAPTMEMMRTEEKNADTPLSATVMIGNDNHDERQNDDLFSAEVRLRMTERKLNDVREKMEGRVNGTGDQIEIDTRVTGAEQLMNTAKIQLEQGNAPAALSASNDALKHAHGAEKRVRSILGEE